MATLDTSKQYTLKNIFTGPSKALSVSASDGATLEMKPASDNGPENQQWFLTDTDVSPFYRLHTVSGGKGLALDVINDKGTASITMHMTGTGQYSGQHWRFDPWSGGTGYRLSNNFTGLEKHLDVYSDTLVPFLGTDDHTGQHWSLAVAVVGGTSTGSAVTSTVTATASAGENSETPARAAASARKFSTGAIVGTTLGSVAILAVLGAAVIWLLRRRRNHPVSALAQEIPAEGDEKKTRETGAEKSVVDSQAKPHLAELGPGHSQVAVELPTPVTAELDATPRI